MNLGEEWCADVNIRDRELMEIAACAAVVRRRQPGSAGNSSGSGHAAHETRSRHSQADECANRHGPRAADPMKRNNGARANARRKRERMQSDAALARRFQPIVRQLINAGRECVLAAFHVER